MAQTDTALTIDVQANSSSPGNADPWASFLHVPTRISVEATIVGLTVRELLRLEKGSILATTQSSATNVPLCAGGRLFAWGELEVSGVHLAVRVAELA
jgi:flagellar motor switch/type III secretory pathway protein FliN